MRRLALIVAVALAGCGTSRCPPGANANSLFCHRIVTDVPAETEMDASAADVAAEDGAQADTVTIDASDGATLDAGGGDDVSDAAARDAKATDTASDGEASDAATDDAATDDAPDVIDPP